MSNRTGVPRTVLTPALRAAVLAAVREGISGQLIADSFGICRSSVSNIAREAGIRRGVKVPRVPDERRAEITARYMAGDGSEDLATEYGTTSATVRRIVLGSGGSTRPLGRVQRPLRHDAFDVLTPEASYWLGMMFTDGTIGHRTDGQDNIALGLKACDRGHLVKFRDFLGSDHAITERAPKQRPFRHERRPVCVHGPVAAACGPPGLPRALPPSRQPGPHRIARLLAGMHRRGRLPERQLRNPYPQAVRLGVAPRRVHRVP